MVPALSPCSCTCALGEVSDCGVGRAGALTSGHLTAPPWAARGSEPSELIHCTLQTLFVILGSKALDVQPRLCSQPSCHQCITHAPRATTGKVVGLVVNIRPSFTIVLEGLEIAGCADPTLGGSIYRVHTPRGRFAPRGQEQDKYFNTQGTGGGKAALCIYLPPVQHFQLVVQLPQRASSQSRTWLCSLLSPGMRWVSPQVRFCYTVWQSAAFYRQSRTPPSS